MRGFENIYSSALLLFEDLYIIHTSNPIQSNQIHQFNPSALVTAIDPHLLPLLRILDIREFNQNFREFPKKDTKANTISFRSLFSSLILI